MKMPDKILLAHGSGGSYYQQLVEEVFVPAFNDPVLSQLADAAVVCGGTEQLAMTTDSFVVRPRFFPGGDIGRLAVCGTVNDLAMSGAVPRWLSCGMVLEAGLPIDELKRICASMAVAAAEAGVGIICGDTKVVEQGAADGIYINTAGIGTFPQGRRPLPCTASEGSVIIVSGTLGDHGLAVLAARENLNFTPPISSDAAPLNGLIADLLAAVPATEWLRDPTRGGVAGVLCEWAAKSGCDIEVAEDALPIAPAVRAACELLGISALHAACEGRVVAAVPAEQAEAAENPVSKKRHADRNRPACL
jgi:hydrogenase expression/formation protein HypE